MSRFDWKTLNDLLRYDPETGILYWRERDIYYCKNEAYVNRWNSRFANMPAGTLSNSDGYLYVSILGTRFSVSRVCWCLANGLDMKDCPTVVDHKNGHTTDNRLVNLRESDYNRNNHNEGLKSNNTTGLKNIGRKNNRWRVTVMAYGGVVDRTFRCLGAAITFRNETMRQMHKDHMCLGRK